MVRHAVGVIEVNFDALRQGDSVLVNGDVILWTLPFLSDCGGKMAGC